MREPRLVSLRPVPSSASTAAIRLWDIRISIQEKELLRGATVSLARHGITAVVGPNGAGKSLLLRILAGLVKPDLGEVEVLPDLGPPAMVFQRPVLLRRTVRGNLMHALRVAGVKRKDRPSKLAHLLTIASLTTLTDMPARRLSGGEQQRLQMARALASEPSWILLDEPTASLDPAATSVFEALVRQISDEGVKVILVTHDRAQAERLGGDIVLMHKGRVVEHKSASDFFAVPDTDEGRAYLAGDLLV